MEKHEEKKDGEGEWTKILDEEAWRRIRFQFISFSLGASLVALFFGLVYVLVIYPCYMIPTTGNVTRSLLRFDAFMLAACLETFLIIIYLLRLFVGYDLGTSTEDQVNLPV
ncbi:hypothetical protein MRB53_018971 [Persea americana]|uniref:Uncharacterized protein n=1 Tax=Persea americana TaxID=3435 RepID=A0ACC2M9E7_PERAE|nr:hypothetical protein MRB53_018971 [Persea americana]